MASIEDLRGEIFLLHMVENMNFPRLKEELELRHGIIFTEKQYKDKAREWGFWKNLRQAVVSDIMHEKSQRDAVGKQSEVFFKSRMVDIDNVERSHKRQKKDKESATKTKAGEIALRTPPPPSPPPHSVLVLGTPTNDLIREKLYHSIDLLVRKSFEKGDWRFYHNERLILVPIVGFNESHNIMTWGTSIDQGIIATKNGHTSTASDRWNEARDVIKPLLLGTHHNIILNILRKLGDLHEAGCSDVAGQMMERLAEESIKHRGSGHALPEIFRLIDSIDVHGTSVLDDRVAEIFCDLFKFYLGYRCYNTSVMTNDRARTRLLRNEWEDIDAVLPDLSTLDAIYGPLNVRSLDVLRLRVEILHHRHQHHRILAESETLRYRASLKVEDAWQRHYFLIKALYYGGKAHYDLGN